MAFWAEFKRRNVFKVGVAYAVVAWLLAQIGSLIFSTFGAPNAVAQVFIVILMLGFPVALLLAWAYEITPAGIKPTADVDVTGSIRRQTGQRLNIAIIALLAIAVVFLIVDNYLPERSRETAIAILPFTNLANDPAQDSFADGFVVELHNNLAQIDDLRVSALAASLSFRDSDRSLPSIAAELGVDYLLEGGINKDGDTLRVIASLIRAEDGSSVWSNPYDREFNNPLAMQLEIAEAVAERLSATFGIGEFDVRTGGTNNIEAYDHYLSALGLAQALSGLQFALLEDAERMELEFQRALSSGAKADRRPGPDGPAPLDSGRSGFQGAAGERRTKRLRGIPGAR